jgi:hypothetical protein
MSDGGGAELAVDCDIATLGAKGGAHRIGDYINTLLKPATGVFGKYELFCSHISFLQYTI